MKNKLRNKLLIPIICITITVGCSRQKQPTVKDLKDVVKNYSTELESLELEITKPEQLENLLPFSSEIQDEINELKEKQLSEEEIYNPDLIKKLKDNDKKIKEQTYRNILASYKIKGFKVDGKEIEIKGTVYADTRESKVLENRSKIQEIINAPYVETDPIEKINEYIQNQTRISDIILDTFNTNTEVRTEEEIQKDLDELKRVVYKPITETSQPYTIIGDINNNLVEPTDLSIYYKITEDNTIELDKEKTIESIREIM
jgi:hypothetical protein